jgi:matrixin
VPHPPNAVDVESVALHEIGHILGLGHSTVPSAVMFAGLSLGATKRVLTTDDIQGVRLLYPIVPRVLERRIRDAAALVQTVGLVPRFFGPTDINSWVAEQSPSGGTRARCNSTVKMRTMNTPRP